MLHNRVPNFPKSHWYSSRDLQNQDFILQVSTCKVKIYAFCAKLKVFAFVRISFRKVLVSPKKYFGK